MRVLCALLTLTLLGCPGGGAASSDAFDAAKARGKLIVAMEVGYDPFEVQLADGSYDGFDVHLAREIAEDLGVELELKNVGWEGIISDLLTGKADLIVSGMSITAERQEAVNFSEPYYSVGQVVATRIDDERITSWEDLNSTTYTVATQAGTTGEQAIRRLMPELPTEQLLTFPQINEACVNLVQGRADAVVFDHPFIARYMTEQPGKIRVLWDPFTEEEIGVAVHKDSPKMLEAVNATLTRLRESGAMDTLIERWFPAPPGQEEKPAEREPKSSDDGGE